MIDILIIVLEDTEQACLRGGRADAEACGTHLWPKDQPVLLLLELVLWGSWLEEEGSSSSLGSSSHRSGRPLPDSQASATLRLPLEGPAP